MSVNENIKSKNEKMTKSNIANDDRDSSAISDFNENDSVTDAFNYDNNKGENKSCNINDMDEEAANEYVKTVVCDRVVKYMKLDDLIKEKQSEHKKDMKAIKDSKEKLEKFLLNYLDQVHEEFIQIKNDTKLIKTEKTTKSALKMEDISSSLIEGFKKYEIYEDDVQIDRVVTDLLKTIDSKRKNNTRKFIQRVNTEDKKNSNPIPKKTKKIKYEESESRIDMANVPISIHNNNDPNVQILDHVLEPIDQIRVVQELVTENQELVSNTKVKKKRKKKKEKSI